MKGVDRILKASKLAQDDVISRMPENVITNITNRLPIRDAMRTSILASNWRFMWTMLTKLVFDEKFSKYLQGPNGEEFYDERNISRILLNLKGPIEKFYLDIPNYKVLNVKDISHWIMFLSRNGIKELTLRNKHQELQHLKLRNFFFRLPHSFHGFPNLFTLVFVEVSLESHKGVELMTGSRLLEKLCISLNSYVGKVKLYEISKLQNLKLLIFPLSKLDIRPVTSSSMFQLVVCFPKLQELRLDLSMCEFLAEAGRKDVSTTFPCLKILAFGSIDFANDIMLSFIYEMIFRSPNLKNLEILALKDYVPTRAEADFDTTRQLQLPRVTFLHLKGSNNEVCFIDSLLACSPLLEKISNGLNSSSMVDGADGRCKFAEKLLKLHRVSPVAEIVFL